jgi:hypothetical protein
MSDKLNLHAFGIAASCMHVRLPVASIEFILPAAAAAVCMHIMMAPFNSSEQHVR